MSSAPIEMIEMRSPDPLGLAWAELSDLGNARRLRDRRGGLLLHVKEWGWLAYDGISWSMDHGERLAAIAAHDVADGMRSEIAALAAFPDDQLAERFGAWCTSDVRKNRLVELRKHSVLSGNAAKTAGMLAQAAHLLAAEKEDFDRDLFAVNALNGTIRPFRDAEKRIRFRRDDHDPVNRITRACAVAWDPDARCPKWDEHLEKVLPSKRTRDFLQEAVGYSFSGSTREQVVFFLQGRGGDGKSTIMDTLRELAGSYGLTADVKSFLDGPDRSGADASPDVFRMMGDSRLISTSEPKFGQALAEDRIKAMTGSGRLAARAPYGRDVVEFHPRGKLFLECNNKPRIVGSDDGIWRRILVIPFPYQFGKPGNDPIIKGYEEQLRPEWPGILNWVLEGMARWIERGRLDPPPEVLEAVEDYRSAANPFGEWFAERVDLSDPLAKTASAALYEDYKSWCDANGVGDRDIFTTKKFGILLGDRQLLRSKGGDGRVLRRGCKLRSHVIAGGPALPPGKTVWDEADEEPLP